MLKKKNGWCRLDTFTSLGTFSFWKARWAVEVGFTLQVRFCLMPKGAPCASGWETIWYDAFTRGQTLQNFRTMCCFWKTATMCLGFDLSFPNLFWSFCPRVSCPHVLRVLAPPCLSPACCYSSLCFPHCFRWLILCVTSYLSMPKLFLNLSLSHFVLFPFILTL